MKLDKRDIITVLFGSLSYPLECVCWTQEGDLDKVLDLTFFARLQEGRKGVSPSLDVGQATKDRLDVFESRTVIIGAAPIKLNHFGTSFGKFEGAHFSKVHLVSEVVGADSVAFPYSNTNIFVTSFNQGHGDAISKHTRSGRDAIGRWRKLSVRNQPTKYGMWVVGRYPA